jgi:hypothetical protein
MKARTNSNEILIRKPQGRHHLKDLGVDGRERYEIFRKNMRMWIGLKWIRMRVQLKDRVNALKDVPSNSTKCRRQY